MEEEEKDRLANSSCRYCDICHAEEEQGDVLVACNRPESEMGSCPRCSADLRAHEDCLRRWHDALPRSASFSQSCASSSSNSNRVRSRSASSLSSDVARRLRGALLSSRQRRSPSASDGENLMIKRSRSASSSPNAPCGVVAATASCGDLRLQALQLEDVFEPRHAPYTPPLRLRSSSSTESFTGLGGGSLSEGEIESLEKKLFEPRDAACTPPLGKRPSSSLGERRRSSTHSIEETEGISVMSVPQLQEAIGQMRVEAKAKSSLLIEQIRQKTKSGEMTRSASQLTVRQLSRLNSSSSVVGQPQMRLRSQRSAMSATISCC